jgi:hypothetical protein
MLLKAAIGCLLALDSVASPVGLSWQAFTLVPCLPARRSLHLFCLPCTSSPFCSFECKSDGQYFSVQHVSLEPVEDDMEDSAYSGPVSVRAKQCSKRGSNG